MANNHPSNANVAIMKLLCYTLLYIQGRLKGSAQESPFHAASGIQVELW